MSSLRCRCLKGQAVEGPWPGQVSRCVSLVDLKDPYGEACLRTVVDRNLEPDGSIPHLYAPHAFFHPRVLETDGGLKRENGFSHPSCVPSPLRRFPSFFRNGRSTDKTPSPPSPLSPPPYVNNASRCGSASGE